MSYFVEDLITSIKARSFAPINQKTFDDDKIVKLINEEMQLKLVSDLVTVREDFFLSSKIYPVIQNKSFYEIPSRAIGGALKSVFYVLNGLRVELNRVDLPYIEDYSNATGTPEKFTIEGDEIRVLPTPSQTLGEIHFHFAKSPNDVILTTNCARISNYTDNGTTIVFDVNTDLTGTLIVGSKVDFISSRAPFKSWHDECAIVQITSTQIEVLKSSIINEVANVDIEVDDYICPTGTSCLPQIPLSFHIVLAQMVACQILSAIGYTAKLQIEMPKLEQMRREALALVKNRVETSPITYKATTVGSFLT